MNIKLQEVFLHSSRIFCIFINGYFALFIVYKSDFLNYDTLTRIVLAISASLLLFIPSAFAYGKTIDEVRMFYHSFFVISLFSIIGLFNYETMVKQNPLFYLVLILIVFMLNFLIKKSLGETKFIEN